MESLSKQELISTITKQADQIKRYEGRLRDVVAAYKGLAKEKEALEISLKALNKTEAPTEGSGDDSVAALTLSLSTLAGEKSRMEEAFQADKKVTRDKYEGIIAGMKEETKTLVQQHLAEINSLKAKIAYEIQEREKERADHGAMLKELHLKLNSERKTKEKLEDKVVNTTEAQASQVELEKRVRDLSSSLSAAQRRLQRAEARGCETPALLARLQHKLALVDQAHALAIRKEQIKAKRAEESARKTCARQEERVALLESKLAELSETVGQYDLRRRRDQALIHQLKAELNGKLLDKIPTTDLEESPELQQKSETDNEKLADSEYIQTLIDKIHILKKELIAENDKLGSPIDITTIFKVDGYENAHVKCREEYDSLRAEFDVYKLQNVRVGDTGCVSEIADLKSEIAVLKEKVEAYRMMLEEEKQDKLDTLKLYEEKLKNEQDYHVEVTADLKTRVQSLEKQVLTQRDRYAALLDETDNYIRARNDRARKVSVDEHWKDGHAMLNDVSAPPHMMHYAHELARKDLDISQLRKDKHIMEGQFRDCQRDATIEKERFKEVVRTLKEEIERLRRIQSREGANLEYLKNVVMAYLMSADYAGRKHMLNAIAAVLHFTDSEKNLVLSTL